MAELSREEIERIVEEQMPGWALASEPSVVEAAPDIAAPPEASTPDVDALRRKYLGEQAATATDVTGSLASEEYTGPGAAEGVGDVAVVIEPKQTGDAWDRGPGPKTVIISGEEKKIVSAQG